MIQITSDPTFRKNAVHKNVFYKQTQVSEPCDSTSIQQCQQIRYDSTENISKVIHIQSETDCPTLYNAIMILGICMFTALKWHVRKTTGFANVYGIYYTSGGNKPLTAFGIYTKNNQYRQKILINIYLNSSNLKLTNGLIS